MLAENGALVLTLGGVSRDVPVLPGKGQVMLGCTSRDGSLLASVSSPPTPLGLCLPLHADPLGRFAPTSIRSA